VQAAGRRQYCAAVLGAIFALMLTEVAQASSISVFVSILPQKYFVERIAGNHAEVSVMVGPGDSPATYEPTPRQIDALSRARAYFQIGVPFEQVWMPRLRAANPQMLVVDTAAGIKRRDIGESKAARLGRGGSEDPHVWTSPMLVKSMAARIRDTFVKLDPAHAETYENNYRKFASDLEALDAEIRTRLLPYAGRAFLVFHAAWGYFADAYGLRQIAIEAEGKEPGPRTLAHVISEARALGIKAVFVQPQFSRSSAEMIAHQIGGHVVAVDPLAENYIENMRHVAQSFADAMGSP
jgi:zinc transport system substrate-binding protein